MKNRLLSPRILVISSLTLAGAGVLAAWLILTPAPLRKPDRVPARNWAIAKEAIDAFAEAPSANVADREAVVALLEAASIEHAPGVETTAEQRRSLYEMVATWLDLLRQADVDAYIAWREATGFQLFQDFKEAMDTGHLRREDLALGYRYFTGREMPEAIAYAELFRTLFTGALRKNGRELRPERIAAGDDVGGVQFATTSTLSSAEYHSLFYTIFGYDYRFTMNNGSDGRVHWRLPIAWEEVVERDGEILAAYLRVGVGNPKGQWFPFEIYCYYDPQGGQWLLEVSIKSNTYTIKTSYEY